MEPWASAALRNHEPPSHGERIGRLQRGHWCSIPIQIRSVRWKFGGRVDQTPFDLRDLILNYSIVCDLLRVGRFSVSAVCPVRVQRPAMYLSYREIFFRSTRSWLFTNVSGGQVRKRSGGGSILSTVSHLQSHTSIHSIILPLCSNCKRIPCSLWIVPYRSLIPWPNSTAPKEMT